MDHVVALECLVCARRYDPDEIEYVCPDHGDDGIVDVVYDHELISARFARDRLAGRGMWRYRPLLPVPADGPIGRSPLLVGDTPIHEATRMAARLGIRRTFVKDEGRQPTGSLKDRASEMALVKAAQRNAAVITTSSTGNAAAALSGICASVAQPNVIFVPADAPPAKVAQLLTYGSTVMLVEGTYDRAVELCMHAAATRGWYNRTTGFNPYMSEGKKTAAFEIAEQLGWRVPDAVVVSVGDGCIVGGLHKGFRDLEALGWVDGLPRLIGVQAEGSNYLAEAWEKGEDVLTKPAIEAHTIADSIGAGLPRDRLKALRAITGTNGAYVTVSDEEILAAVPAMARDSGVFGEPAGAAAHAGLVRAVDQGLVGADETVVVLNTGSGLKDVEAARRAAESSGTRPIRVEPTVEALEAALQDVDPARGGS